MCRTHHLFVIHHAWNTYYFPTFDTWTFHSIVKGLSFSVLRLSLPFFPSANVWIHWLSHRTVLPFGKCKCNFSRSKVLSLKNINDVHAKTLRQKEAKLHFPFSRAAVYELRQAESHIRCDNVFVYVCARCEIKMLKYKNKTLIVLCILIILHHVHSKRKTFEAWAALCPLERQGSSGNKEEKIERIY